MQVRLDSEAEAARMLGRRGGLGLAAKWRLLRERAAAGDAVAQRELEARQKSMSERGRKGGRPKTRTEP